MSNTDITQLFTLIDALLLSVGFSMLVLGLFLGWFIRGRFEIWLWFRRGVYCDDCCPLVDCSKDQGGI